MYACCTMRQIININTLTVNPRCHELQMSKYSLSFYIFKLPSLEKQRTYHGYQILRYTDIFSLSKIRNKAQHNNDSLLYQILHWSKQEYYRVRCSTRTAHNTKYCRYYIQGYTKKSPVNGTTWTSITCSTSSSSTIYNVVSLYSTIITLTSVHSALTFTIPTILEQNHIKME